MANTIKLKRSSTASDTPSASDLEVGELAINTADAKLFTKHTDNSIKEISGSGGGGGSGTIASQDADSVNIDGGAIDGVTLGTNSAVSELQVDNINIDGNVISSTNQNGPIAFNTNGSGTINLNDTVKLGPFSSSAGAVKTITTNGTSDLKLDTNGGTDSGSILIADGANGNISLTPDGTGSVVITSTDAGADAGPVLKFNRDSASPASNDFLGEIQFDGDDAGGNSTTYAKITGIITDTTDGSENGRIKFDVLGNGSFSTFYQIGFGGNFFYKNLNLMQNTDLIFEGSTDDTNETTLTVADPTADRTITLPDATGTVALTSDIPSSGISNGNVATFTSGVADNDFLKINGTSVEGRSAAEVLDDIGAMPLSQSINAQTGSMETALSDAGNIITLNSSSAITVTIAPNFSVAYPIGTRIDFIQIGAGQVTFEGGTGVTVNATPTLKLRAQHSAASCIQIATNIWQLVGDLAES